MTDRKDSGESDAALDILRLQVCVVPDRFDTVEVKVFINQRDVCAAGAGLGMDPFAVLIGGNKFVPTEKSRQLVIARCTCGYAGCARTAVVVSRDSGAGTVTWQWLERAPMERPAVFAADQYETEARRAEKDLSWETPSRTAQRLLFDGAEYAVLARSDLRLQFAGDDVRFPDRFQAGLKYEDPDHEDCAFQVFISLPWAGRSPDRMASDIIDILRQPPFTWAAEWNRTRGGRDQRDLVAPPTIAGPAWRPFVPPRRRPRTAASPQ